MPALSPAELILILFLESLPSLHADALGLSGTPAIYLHIRFPSIVYCGGQHRPEVEVSFSASASNKQSSNGTKKTQPAYDRILYRMNRICDAFFADHWPCQTKLTTLNFFVRLYRHLESSVPQLGNLCVVCGRRQEHIGLRPVPCNSKACNVLFDEHGTGADLRDIYSKPVVADLLISMASAASRCIDRRDSLFQCMPINLLRKEKADVTQASEQIDWLQMQQIFHALPSVASLAGEPNLMTSFFDIGLHGGMTKFSLLRWILNNYRGHLMQLQQADQFPAMGTDYQFRLCADDPSKEASFMRLKDKYGSKFLFHGSPFYNWHCILREGLKNMSGSWLMSTGAEYGCGIYLAENTGISKSHCDYKDHLATPAYSNSTLVFPVLGRSSRCIALCEVIDHPLHKKAMYGGAFGYFGDSHCDIRIVSDADNIITRYLFVYRGAAIPLIEASALKTTCEKHSMAQSEALQAVKQAYSKLHKWWEIATVWLPVSNSRKCITILDWWQGHLQYWWYESIFR